MQLFKTSSQQTGERHHMCVRDAGPTKCMQVKLVGGLNVYSERCNRTSLVVDSSLVKDTTFKW
jgi:hypothetical protein